MISLAPIRSAGKAAEYFTKDNFHASVEEAEHHSTWWGKGAEALDLAGEVTRDALQAALEGRLPDGTDLAENGNHRPGFELTFSPPKSVSLLILLGRDQRLLTAHREAVRETLAWAEKNLAQTRLSVAGSSVKVKTDNLLVALVEHDTNRNLEPNIHTHAIVANATQGPDGKWRALVNDLLWQRSALLGSIYHAHLRRKALGYGYSVVPHGKHGTFEINGIPREVIEAYSTRSKEISAAHQSLVHQTPQTRDIMALKTRRYQTASAERGTLMQAWQKQAQDLGIDFEALAATARQAAAPNQNPWRQATHSLARLGERASTFLEYLLVHLKGQPKDPLVPEKPGTLTPDQLAASHAVAAAIRHLSEREAAFSVKDLAKAALDLQLPVTINDIEKRIARLKAHGLLLAGDKRHPDMLTTPEAQDIESRILALAQDGHSESKAVLPLREAGLQVQKAAKETLGAALNSGQETAARLILSSSDRVLGVQGVPGSGKTALLKAVATVLEAHGHKTVGLGHQNRLVRLLERETGITSQTILSFIAAHRGLLDGKLKPADVAALKAEYRGAFLLVDEASMVSNLDKLTLMQIAAKLEVQRLVLVGDKRQLGAIEAGKPFEILQDARLPTAQMHQNIRQRDPALRAAAKAAYEGRIVEAMTALAPMMHEAPDPAKSASETWLALPNKERTRTAIYASGRKIRALLNEQVQAGLLAEGTLKGDGLTLNVLNQLTITREEERHAHIYKPGQRIEFARTLGAADIQRGTWGTITAVDSTKGKVTLTTDTGHKRTFYPQKLAANRIRESVRLYEEKPLHLYAGDQVRWTHTDKERGLLNSDLARIVRMTREGVLVETSTKQQVLLQPDDPMLKRLDLAYALNAHMAQGLTADKAIAVMDSQERNLSNERLFLVTITRIRNGLTFLADDIGKLTRQIERTPGDKTSALEVQDKIKPLKPPTPTAPPLSGAGGIRRKPNLDLG